MKNNKVIKEFYMQIAEWYDEMYVDQKIYQAEARQIDLLIKKYKKIDGNNLLDLACGSGPHIEYWEDKYHIVGLDNNIHMIMRANEKWPQIMFVCGDMFCFSNLSNFDIATCLYGSIGYAESIEEMENAIACVSKCLNPGGIYILTPGEIKEHFENKIFIKSKRLDDKDDYFRKIEMVTQVDENRAIISMNHRIVIDGKAQTYKYEIPISLFGRSDYICALEKNGFLIEEEKNELEFRMGAFICRKQ